MQAAHLLAGPNSRCYSGLWAMHIIIGQGHRGIAQSLLADHFFYVDRAWVGLWANALVLVADAGHMFLDATALA